MTILTYGSVCSGIEAASVAWEPLGFKPSWFAEIEPFPSAVLAYHWPHITNHGDMTLLAAMVESNQIVAPDILVGGTPCQAFSVAGVREGLSDPRGFLTIKYVELVDAIDKKNPCVAVWENVPGVLSSKDNAFGCFLGLLAGEENEIIPPGGKWTNAGCVFGPKRKIAWRVLDAQYFGVAQRRRRVFVVASAREGFDPTAVLFESEGVRRDTAPSREAGKEAAVLTANCAGTCGADDNQGQAGFRMVAFGEYADDETASTMKARDYKDATAKSVAYGVRTANTSSNGCGVQKEVTHTLDTTQGIAVAYSVSLRGREGGATAELGDEVAGCLRASTGGVDTHEQKEPTPLNLQVITRHEQLGRATGFGLGDPGDAAYTLGAGHMHGVWHEMAVRRLMPVECERLQGFPDGHTNVPYRGKPAADGPRYTAIGNSMAIPCMQWIGRRIADALAID